MARARRIEYPGALHHVTAWGNARADIYLDERDRRDFLSLLGDVTRRFGWTCHAWCLMNDHYHLMIETADANLGRGMRQLNGVYTQRFNRAHGRVGHVFQGRYKAFLVERGPYWLELARHVVLNPVRAKLVTTAGDWSWSSYRSTVGLAPATQGVPDPVSPVWVLRQLAGEDRLARAAYRRFVDEGKERPVDPLREIRAGGILGGEDFLDELNRRFGDEADTRLGRGRSRPSIAAICDRERDQGAWMTLAHDRHGYTLAEIGATVHLHYSSVSKIIKGWRETGKVSAFKT
jgi:putative transposase